MKLLTTMNIRNKIFSVLFTFLMSLDMGDIMIIPNSLLSKLNINSHNSYSSNSDNYRTINTRLLPMVGALVTEDLQLNQVQVPGLTKDFSLVGDSFNNGVPEDKLLYRLTESKLSHGRFVEDTTSLENNAEELEDGDEEDSVEISRTVEPQVLQRLESKFLKLFGMNKRPERKENKNIKIPKYLLELYQKQSGNDLPTSNLNLPGRHTRTANTVRTFYLEPGLSKDSKKRVVTSWKGQKNHLQFSLDSIPESEQVTGAELRIPFEIHRNDSSEVLSQLKSVKILIHDIIKPITPPHSKKPKEFHLKEPITYPIDSKSVDFSKRRNGTSTFWLTFDVFPAVNRWIQQQQEKIITTNKNSKKKNTNHGLVLEIIGITNEGTVLSQENLQHSHNLRVKRDLLDESSSSTLSSLKASSSSESKTKTKSSSVLNDDEKGTEVGAVSAVIQQQNESGEQRSSSSSTKSSQPIVLFTYSDDGRNGRKTRDAKTLSRNYRAAQQQKRRKNHKRKNQRRNLCARHNMFVDFTDVGWNDWIVAPPGYQAFHCSGECPFPMGEHLNATNHAVIQALVNSMNPALVPPPCCSPTKYSSLSLLYTDSSDKIVLKNYNEMVVDSCGCS